VTTCAWVRCGRAFHSPNPRAKYCSLSCFGKARWHRDKAEAAGLTEKDWQRVLVICGVDHGGDPEVFKTLASARDEWRAIWGRCARKACGKAFLKRKNKPQQFCSHQCSSLVTRNAHRKRIAA
jgi:hypothetical protein